MQSEKRDVLKWWREQKKIDICMRCPEDDPCVIEYHHVRPETKTASVGNLVHSGASMATVLEEFRKTIPLCRNCHAKEHHFMNRNNMHIAHIGDYRMRA